MTAIILLYKIIMGILYICILPILLFSKNPIWKERLWIKTKPSNKKKNLIWIHAASVGETLVAITLINEISKRFDSGFIITTNTIAAANLIKNIKDKEVIHHFLPLDISFLIQKFLKIYSPNIVIFLESEIWPVTIQVINKASHPLLLLNARMSNKSYNIWKYYKIIASNLLKNFNVIVPQSYVDFKYYKALSCPKQNIVLGGNLKYLATTKIDLSEYQNIFAKLQNRKILLAVSTHPGDEIMILRALKKWKSTCYNILVMIAIRHTSRAKEVLELCAKYGYEASLKSKNHDIKDIFIIDTIGELNAFYTISDIVIIGGSFTRGGHNPIEPLYHNCHIISGPDMTNFLEITEILKRNEAMFQAKNEEELVNKIDELLKNKIKQEIDHSFIENFKKNIIETYIQNIKKYIKQS